jgi:uncharacterized RDD family membrane protein YckC
MDGVPWIVTDLVPGESLDSLLRRTGPLPWWQVAQIGAQIASALAHAHERQIVHRDLKPDNVLLAGTRVLLTDFGIPRAMDGTPHYMSPEQVRNHDVGPASDLWSLGVLLYSVVEGRLPFASPPGHPPFDAILTQPAPPPALTGPLTPLIGQLLSKQAAERPAAAQVAEFLSTFEYGAGAATPQPYPGPGPQWSQPQWSQPQPGLHPGYYGLPNGWQPGYGPGPYLPPQQPWNGPGAGMMPGGIRLAEWGQRLGATVIDSLFLVPAYIGEFYFLSTFRINIDQVNDTDVGTLGPTSAGWAALWVTVGYCLIFQLWQLYQQGKTGQTIGKRVLHIRVVREADGRYTGFGRAVVRQLAHVVDGLPFYVGYFAPLWDAKNQTFADKMCRTVVILDQ